MQKTWKALLSAGLATSIGLVCLARSQEPAPTAKQVPIMVTPADIKWVDAPPSLPAGAKMFVLEGDMQKPGPFTVRVEIPRRLQGPAALSRCRRARDGALRSVACRDGRRLRSREGQGTPHWRLQPAARQVAPLRLHESGNHHPASRRRTVDDHLRQSSGRSEDEEVGPRAQRFSGLRRKARAFPSSRCRRFDFGFRSSPPRHGTEERDCRSR